MAIPILWRTTKERYSLQSDVCPECERVVFPPRRLCPYCGRDAAVHGAQYQQAGHQQAKEAAADEIHGETHYAFPFVLPTSVELSAAGDD